MLSEPWVTRPSVARNVVHVLQLHTLSRCQTFGKHVFSLIARLCRVRKSTKLCRQTLISPNVNSKVNDLKGFWTNHVHWYWFREEKFKFNAVHENINMLFEYLRIPNEIEWQQTLAFVVP